MTAVRPSVEDHAATVREALHRLTADEHYRNAEENSLYRAALSALAALAERATELERDLTNMERAADRDRRDRRAAEARAEQLETALRTLVVTATARVRLPHAAPEAHGAYMEWCAVKNALIDAIEAARAALGETAP